MRALANHARVGIALALAVLIASGSSCDGGATPVGPKARIACSGPRDVYVVNADGSGLRRLTRHPTRDPAGSNGDQSPAWSHDGRRVAFERWLGYSNSEIYVVNVDGSGLQRLTRSPESEQFPVWSPDGSSIAFVSVPDDSGNFKIYVMDADGSGRRRLMQNPGFSDHPAWSPDGGRIAFTRTFSVPSDAEAYDSEIYVINSDGSGLRRLTRRPVMSPGSEDPAWSPDGRSIAFVHSPNGEHSEINVMNADGSGRRTLIPGDHRPAWSPDGRRIAFIRNPHFHLGVGHLRHQRRRQRTAEVDAERSVSRACLVARWAQDRVRVWRTHFRQ